MVRIFNLRPNICEAACEFTQLTCCFATYFVSRRVLDDTDIRPEDFAASAKTPAPQFHACAVTPYNISDTRAMRKHTFPWNRTRYTSAARVYALKSITHTISLALCLTCFTEQTPQLFNDGIY